MEAKKLAAPVKRVVSGFHMCIAVSLIVFTVMLFDCSLKSPIIDPMFQGFSSRSTAVSDNSSSVKTWSFSSSKSSPVLGSVSTVSTNVSSNLRNYEDFNVTHVSNLSNSAQIEDFFPPNRTGVVLKDTHSMGMGNSSDKEGIIGNSSVENGDVILNTTHVSEVVMEKTHLGNLSEVVKNESLIVKVPKILANAITAVKSGEGQSIGEERNVSFINDGKIRAAEKVGEVPYESCDIFDGRWVKDDSKPYYPAGSCPYVDRDFDCHLNGRPDDGFLKWKWQPNGCDMPSLNASDFLERLRGKKLVFVGDSLNRNMWESLVCILRHSIKDKKRVYEISGKKEFKKKGFYAFIFEDYNCTVDFVSAPFLVRESSHKTRNGTFEALRLDLMDQTTSMYNDADVTVFNTGHWWTHEKTSKGEDYYQEGNYVHPRLKVLNAYKKALTTWAKWVDKNIDSKRTQVIFRGYSVTHFRGGQWNSGGQCNAEVEPIFNETYLSKYPSKMRALQTVLKEMKTPITYLNISRLTDYRKDGHPSIYRTEYKTTAERASAEHTQDCSHWCLPGVPDTWNELLYASLLKAGKGSWRR